MKRKFKHSQCWDCWSWLRLFVHTACLHTNGAYCLHLLLQNTLSGFSGTNRQISFNYWKGNCNGLNLTHQRGICIILELTPGTTAILTNLSNGKWQCGNGHFDKISYLMCDIGNIFQDCLVCISAVYFYMVWHFAFILCLK